MDDLISRSALISRFKQLQGSDTLANMFVSDVIKEVKNQPTAYNVDKVAEQIEEVLQDLNVLEIMCHLDLDSTIQNDLDNFLQAIKNEILRRLKAGEVNG